MVSKYKKSGGWFSESSRHSLSAKGVKTGRKQSLLDRELEYPIEKDSIFTSSKAVKKEMESPVDYAKYEKTFKIGEYAKGGVITAQVSGDKVTIIGKDWDMTAGSNKSSDQSNAKEFTRLTVDINDYNYERELDDFLNDLTTSYYAEEVIDWVNSKKAKKKFDFAKKDWKKADWVSFVDYQWYTPDSSLSISSTQDRDGKNAFVYSVNLMTGLSSLGGVHKKVIWKGRNEKLAKIKAQEYMKKNLR